MPGVHSRFLVFFEKQDEKAPLKVLDQYNYLAVKFNFHTAEFGVDRIQE